MNVKFAYVCFSCNQIMERAPLGECRYCGSERIAPISSLMHEGTRADPFPDVGAQHVAPDRPTVIDAWFAAHPERA